MNDRPGTVVIDASTVVAALIDSGPDGRWAEAIVVGRGLAAPHFLPIEVTAVLRRAERAGAISGDNAALARASLSELRVHYFEYEPFGGRIWSLRHTVTAYDSWYVALAEALDAPLATLDDRLANAPGPRCSFLLPEHPARRG